MPCKATKLRANDRRRLPGALRPPAGAHRGGRGGHRAAPRAARTKPGSPRRRPGGGVRVFITGPQGLEKTVPFALDVAPRRIARPAAAPAHGRRAEEAVGGWPENGRGGDGGACERRREEAPPEARGADADHRGDEAATPARASRPPAGSASRWPWRPGSASPIRSSLDRRRTFPSGVRLLITVPPGFERAVAFALAEAPTRIVRPAARRRMAAAQRKRWVAARKAKAARAATPVPAKAASTTPALNDASPRRQRSQRCATGRTRRLRSVIAARVGGKTRSSQLAPQTGTSG